MESGDGRCEDDLSDYVDMLVAERDNLLSVIDLLKRSVIDLNEDNDWMRKELHLPAGFVHSRKHLSGLERLASATRMIFGRS